MKFLTVPMMTLRDTQQFYAEIRNQQGLDDKIKALVTAAAAFFGVYGLIIGMFNGAPQALSSAFKLPILFILTLLICFPTLHIFNLLFGSRHSIAQYFTLLLAATAIISVLLLAFAPITILFLTTSDNYQFFKLLNVAIFTIAGINGIKFFYRGMGAITQEVFTKQAQQTPAAQPVEKLAPVLEEQAIDTAQRPVAHSELVQTFEAVENNSDERGHSQAAAVSNKQRDNATERKSMRTRRKIARLWILLYAIVGSQLSWVLRPFFGAPGEPFELLRNTDGNFYANVGYAILRILGVY